MFKIPVLYFFVFLTKSAAKETLLFIVFIKSKLILNYIKYKLIRLILSFTTNTILKHGGFFMNADLILKAERLY